ncbi:winged helix-turn-helix domain-containing protein [Micromonospora sp. R77]|uniref:winged helix-turn-helix domain-containing protein n=1 Tax=Micromonospora sp. R77 TaxID=2925836 RepID=UPI001F61C680|nr:winged helix-turn-helix domain-containing protein [Micromonospora sp. R77]MCI4067050.1 winged helix-turn-helix domain-containing protein [Micromonospora sp. R77]
MSVVAISPRVPRWPPRPGGAPAAHRADPDHHPRPRSRRPHPGLALLVEVLGDLAATGEVVPQHPAAPPRAVGPWPRATDPLPSAADAESDRQDPEPVRVLAASREVRQGVRAVPLTRIEFDLLHFLAAHPRRVFTRAQLLSHVWGYEHAVARTVDVHVRRLRAKFGPDTPLLTTVYGVGYRLADAARVVVEPDH